MYTKMYEKFSKPGAVKNRIQQQDELRKKANVTTTMGAYQKKYDTNY